MGDEVKETGPRYLSAARSAQPLSLPPRLGALVTEITEIPDMDAALRKILVGYLELKLEALEAQIADLEAKWGMSFELFSASAPRARSFVVVLL